MLLNISVNCNKLPSVILVLRSSARPQTDGELKNDRTLIDVLNSGLIVDMQY